MRPLVTLSVGLVFTGLVIGVPLSQGMSSGGPRGSALWLLYGLPVGVLVACMWTRRPWVGVWLFPLSHLPALVWDTQLIASPLYEGTAGVIRLTVIALVGWIWFVAFMRRGPEGLQAANDEDSDGPRAETPTSVPGGGRPRIGRALPAVALGVGGVIFGVFLNSALTVEPADPLAANLTLVVGLLISWYVVTHHVLGTLGEVLLDPGARGRARAALLFHRRQPSRRHFDLLELVLAWILVVIWHAA